MRDSGVPPRSPRVLSEEAGRRFEAEVPVVVIGAGACGLVAALTVADAGLPVLVLERDRVPAGSTALSSGFIPACESRVQRELGIDDSVARMVADIRCKNHGQGDAPLIEAICRVSGGTVDWLTDRHGIPFVMIDGFLYPGHSALRMHAVPERTGAALVARLNSACTTAGVDILASAQAEVLYTSEGQRIRGVGIVRPSGIREAFRCDALILACSGFGGNPDLVRRHIPEMAAAEYFGHPGNQGDALLWGEALRAATGELSAYQGHGSVATPHGILVTWALMMEGGVQVNAAGSRFSNEHQGYSEQSVAVLAQPGGIAWDIYDHRLHQLGLQFDDYRQAVAASAVRSAPDLVELARQTGLPVTALAATLNDVGDYAAGRRRDPWGRDFGTKPLLRAPYHAIRVTGALFHTQGGLAVDTAARVRNAAGQPMPNLFAGGGAAAGVSGPTAAGYLSGNGLLAAVMLGRLAGQSAVAQLCGG